MARRRIGTRELACTLPAHVLGCGTPEGMVMVGYEVSIITRSRCRAIRRTGSRRGSRCRMSCEVDDPIDGRHSEAVTGDKGYPVEQLKQMCCLGIRDSALTAIRCPNSASCALIAGWDNDSQTLIVF